MVWKSAFEFGIRRMLRTVLPHEPSLPSNLMGYLIVQGSFTIKTKNKIQSPVNETTLSTPNEDPETFRSNLLQRFRSLNGASPPNDLELVDGSLTKVKLSFDSIPTARKNMEIYQRTTPAQLFGNEHLYPHKFLQVSLLTTAQLPHPSWTRTTPPKFRRLIARPGEDVTLLQKERQTTRFVLLTNLVEAPCVEEWERDPKRIAGWIRNIVGPYDTSGDGIEVFVPTHVVKRSRHVHIGMRSAIDAQTVVNSLQDRVVHWNERMASGRLFVDYAAITNRSKLKATIRDQGQNYKEPKGEPTRPQCTSTTDHIEVPGLVLVRDFVSPAQEQVLMATLTGPHAPWAPSQCTQSFAHGTVKRSVQHYGYVFDYETANVLRDRSGANASCPPMPTLNSDNDESVRNMADFVRDGRGWEVLAGTIERVRRREFVTNDGSVSFPNINQLTVNQYEPGEGIGSHVDTPSAFLDGLISISLNGGLVMEFRSVKDKSIKKLVYLPPRSLLLMSGDARYTWEHMIVNRMTDTHNGQVLIRNLRVSLTLRTALAADGTNPMPLVDSWRFPPIWGNSKETKEHWATPTCEKDHVHAVYDAIAKQWHHTRGKRGVLWPGATQFLQRLPPGSIVADVGCGDGKYFPAIWEAGSYVVGSDISEPLLRTAIHDPSVDDRDMPETRRLSSHRHHLRNKPAVVAGDCMNVPLRSNSCDAAICIAVMHHLSTDTRRERCIEELVRIVKPGGVVNVQAWALDQEEDSRRRFAANDVYVPFNAQPKYLSISEENGGLSSDSEISKESKEGKSTAQVYSEAFNNAEYDDSKGLVVFKRYCHLYRKGELDEIALRVPGVKILDTGFESGNYFIVFNKVANNK